MAEILLPTKTIGSGQDAQVIPLVELTERQGPRLAVQERSLSPLWSPGTRHVFAYSAYWVGSCVLRPVGRSAALEGEAINAVLNLLQHTDNFCELPLELPTYDPDADGSLALNSTSTALQADQTTKLVFSSLTTAQRNAKLPIGTWVRWGTRMYQVQRHNSSNSSVYVIGPEPPAKVSNLYPALSESNTVRARLGQVNPVLRNGIYQAWAVSWQEWTG